MTVTQSLLSEQPTLTQAFPCTRHRPRTGAAPVQAHGDTHSSIY